MAATAERRGSVYRIDPRNNRVAARIRVGSGPGPLAFAGGSVWVANTSGPGDALMRIDPRRNRVAAAIPRDSITGGFPTDVKGSREGLWVAAEPDGLVRIDTATNRVVQRISLRGVTAVAPLGDGIWAARNLRDRPGTVTKLDRETGVTIKTVRVGRTPIALAVGGGAVWVANFNSGTVSRIRTDR